ncbi:FecR domain-containing protein [Aquiflexum sp. LQ15W]|uniref:FecR family protein n=1 Tax=Cognataquiflexum nitidum TaxID=2922272 RepID=UPI001F134F9A|nr:FecR domain-containing protein [Cognataquiflexum nitidum]MCH6200493.1 FecR domain-containing protein [Cognataquiflexum nitidum]
MEPTDEQLARWLERPSQDDIQDLNEWLDKSPENIQKWESYQLLWQNSAKLASRMPLPDRERIWSGIEAEIGEKKTFAIPAFFKYAAAAAIFLTISVSIWLSTSSKQEHYIANNGPLEIWLSDSSRVVLKEGAELKVSNTYLVDERTVVLQGDAFFEVKRNEEKPFLVQTESHFVKVLGTSFLVQTPQTEEATVSVFSGKVEFGLPSGQSRILTKDMSLTILGDQFIEKEKSANDLAWWTGELKYDNAPLSQFVADMAYNFGIEVKVSATSLMGCGLTAKFEGLTPDEMVQAVAMTFGSELQQSSQSGVVMQGGNCETGGGSW